MRKNIIKPIFVFALCSFMLLVSGFTAADNSFADTYRCYYLTPTSMPRWINMSLRASTKQDCYKLDYCDRGGACYKWATGPDQPGQPW